MFCKKLPIVPLLLCLSTLCQAETEGAAHWVCENETLYRKLLAARLYGVGQPPEQGCLRLPTDIEIEQIDCQTSDIELCRYRWPDQQRSQPYWGSAIIGSIANSRP